MNALKLELFWGNAPLRVDVFSSPPPSAEAWGLRAVTRVDGGFQLERAAGQPVRVHHGDRARVRVGDFELVATSLERERFIGRRQLRRWPWLFLCALTVSVSAFAVFLSQVPDAYDDAPEPQPDYPRIAHHLLPLAKRPAFTWRWGTVRPMPIRFDPFGPPPRPVRMRRQRLGTAVLRQLIGPVRSVPSIDRAMLAKVIDAHRDEVVACRERTAQQGRVLFQWTVDVAGHAHGVEALSTHSSPDFETCMLVALRVWRFPPGRGNPVVYFPF